MEAPFLYPFFFFFCCGESEALTTKSIVRIFNGSLSLLLAVVFRHVYWQCVTFGSANIASVSFILYFFFRGILLRWYNAEVYLLSLYCLTNSFGTKKFLQNQCDQGKTVLWLFLFFMYFHQKLIWKLKSGICHKPLRLPNPLVKGEHIPLSSLLTIPRTLEGGGDSTEAVLWNAHCSRGTCSWLLSCLLAGDS